MLAAPSYIGYASKPPREFPRPILCTSCAATYPLYADDIRASLAANLGMHSGVQATAGNETILQHVYYTARIMGRNACLPWHYFSSVAQGGVLPVAWQIRDETRVFRRLAGLLAVGMQPGPGCTCSACCLQWGCSLVQDAHVAHARAPDPELL